MKFTSRDFCIISFAVIGFCAGIACENLDIKRIVKVKNGELTEISYYSVTVTGIIVDTGDGITEHGHCWSLETSPTIDQNRTKLGETITKGTFSSELDDLEANTTYYVRVYAVYDEEIKYGDTELEITTGAFPHNIEVIGVEGGTFSMGSSTGDPDETPVHSVTLDSFSISKYEITNQLFATFLNEYGSNLVKNGTYAGERIAYENDWSLYQEDGTWYPVDGYEQYPVINVTWYGAYEFCRFYGGILPTEAEWEYASRGGNRSEGYIYSGSNIAGEVAWYYDNSENIVHLIGQKSANELKIYDLSGNVSEWCADFYNDSYYSASPQSNPTGATSGTSRIVRGGNWYSDKSALRVANRIGYKPEYKATNIGFRFVE